jgi:hypothetical protein
MLVIELADLEMLIGAAQATGRSVLAILDEWSTGDGRGWSLSNYLLTTYRNLGAGLRPPAVTAGILRLLDRLKGQFDGVQPEQETP